MSNTRETLRRHFAIRFDMIDKIRRTVEDKNEQKVAIENCLEPLMNLFKDNQPVLMKFLSEMDDDFKKKFQEIISYCQSIKCNLSKELVSYQPKTTAHITTRLQSTSESKPQIDDSKSSKSNLTIPFIVTGALVALFPPAATIYSAMIGGVIGGAVGYGIDSLGECCEESALRKYR